MTPAMIHYWPAGGGRRISTPGYVSGTKGYVLDGRGIKELAFPWFSVYPPSRVDPAVQQAYDGTLARTTEAMIRRGSIRA